MFPHCSSSFHSAKALGLLFTMETSEKLIQICGWIEITLSIVLRSGYVLSRARETEKHTKVVSNIIQCELQSHWNYASVENSHSSVIHPFILLANKDITQVFAGRHSWVFFMTRSKLPSSMLNFKQPEILKQYLTCRMKLHKRERERCNSWFRYMLTHIKYIL